MPLVSDACSAAEGGPLSHAHMGGRCGNTCSTQTRSDDLWIPRQLGLTARQSANTSTVAASPGNVPGLTDPFDPFVDYVTARLVEDPHLWARTLFDELEDLGFDLSYQSLTRNIRIRNLRPVCEARRTATERPNASSRIRREMKPSGTRWNCPTRQPRGDG